MYLEQEVKSARDKERAAVFIPPKERSKDKKKSKASSHPTEYLVLTLDCLAHKKTPTP